MIFLAEMELPISRLIHANLISRALFEGVYQYIYFSYMFVKIPKSLIKLNMSFVYELRGLLDNVTLYYTKLRNPTVSFIAITMTK